MHNRRDRESSEDGAAERWRTAALVVAACTTLGLLFSTQIYLDAAYSRSAISATQALTLALAGWYGWALFFPAVYWLARRFPLARPVRAGHVAIHILASLVLTFGKLAATGAVLAAVGFAPRQVTSTINIPLNYVTYWAMAGAVWALALRRRERAERLRAARLEASLAGARLDALALQLQPHFLFNTLNSIAELMHEDTAAAERVVGRLSALLRATLDAPIGHEVPLDRELALLDAYLSIERVRFEERLRVRIVTAADTGACLVPRFLLQPIVENAVRHAVSPRREGGAITIEAERRDDRLLLTVADDGPGLNGASASGRATGGGIGLANVRARLETLYGDQQAFAIVNNDTGGVDVRIHLPFRLEPSTPSAKGGRGL
jgi:two-component system, LytTR family, sensor kinase